MYLLESFTNMSTKHMINVSLTLEKRQVCTYSPAEKATAGAALVLYHAIAVVFAQD